MKAKNSPSRRPVLLLLACLQAPVVALALPEGEQAGEGALDEVALQESPYAPLAPSLQWPEVRSDEILHEVDVTCFPSLAADLAEAPPSVPRVPVADPLRMVEAEGDALPFVSISLPPVDFLAEDSGTESTEVVEARQAVGPVYDIRAVPHPMLAGLAAFAGLVIVSGRRDQSA